MIARNAFLPEGAEDLDPYLAGTRLSFEVAVDGELDDLAVGDALVLTYTLTLEGLPSIFLPPLAPDLELPGLSAYPETPVLEDGPVARRVEKVTLVLESGGAFSVPAVTPSRTSRWGFLWTPTS